MPKEKPSPNRRLRPLPRTFYSRPVLTVARECIGKSLVHSIEGRTTVGAIVEAEAYRGPEDRAAHSFGGRRTKRTEPMFGRAGHAYVFFVYGMHWNFNVITGRVGDPHVVLIRAVEPLAGKGVMASRRGMREDRIELTNGPGKLCQAFAITGDHTGIDLCKARGAPAPTLFLADGPQLPTVRAPRVGIDYAGAWVSKPWRFCARGNRFVSRPRPG